MFPSRAETCSGSWGGGPSWLNLATRQRGQAELNFRAYFKTADDREAYSVS
jgi:hypothetical protein